MLLTVHPKIRIINMVDEADKLQILYDHYKETLTSIKETNKTRDRLLVFAVVLIGILFFQIISPEDSSDVFIKLLSQKAGFIINIDLNVISGIIWFFLFVIVLKYFQSVVFSERQYPYLKKVEEEINALCRDKNFISREGSSYLTKYPKFSDWIHCVYRIILPLILIALILIKIIKEWQCVNVVSSSLLFDSIIFIFITITTILYLCYIHFGK